MNNIINVLDLPKRQFGNKEIIDWINMNNAKVRFNYKGIKGVLNVSFYERCKGGVKLKVVYKDKTQIIFNTNFIKGKIGVLIGEISKNHKYEVGDIVNNITVLEQLRRKDSRGHNILSYKVKCNETGKIFQQTQYNIAYGYGSPYAAGKKVWEDNWLHNEKHLIPLLKKPEDAKKYSIGSDAKILCICPNCNKEKYVIARNLYFYGISCPYCRPFLSYPEKFIMAYLEVVSIRYIHQFKLGELRRYIDFYLPDDNLAIEVNGEQHYRDNQNSKWENSYEKSIISDEIKRKYCIDNQINLLEIDGSKSYFNYLMKSVNDSILPKITTEIKLKMMSQIADRRFNKNEFLILNDYKLGLSSNYISNKYNVSVKHVTNIAKRHGVYKNKNRHIKVKCLNTGIVYDSIAEASRKTGISSNGISAVCLGKRKSTIGKNGEKLYWEKYKESIYKKAIKDKKIN